jgi:hypothetical protein
VQTYMKYRNFDVYPAFRSGTTMTTCAGPVPTGWTVVSNSRSSSNCRNANTAAAWAFGWEWDIRKN